jgi:hypothetical protein
MKKETLEKIEKIILEILENELENVWSNIILDPDQKSFSVSFYFMIEPFLFSDKQYKDLIERLPIDNWIWFVRMISIHIGEFTFKNLKELKNKKKEIVKKIKEEIKFIKENKLGLY